MLNEDTGIRSGRHELCGRHVLNVISRALMTYSYTCDVITTLHRSLYVITHTRETAAEDGGAKLPQMVGTGSAQLHDKPQACTTHATVSSIIWPSSSPGTNCDWC